MWHYMGKWLDSAIFTVPNYGRHSNSARSLEATFCGKVRTAAKGAKRKYVPDVQKLPPARLFCRSAPNSWNPLDINIVEG